MAHKNKRTDNPVINKSETKSARKITRRSFIRGVFLFGSACLIGGYTLNRFLEDSMKWDFLERSDIAPNGVFTSEGKKLFMKSGAQVESEYPRIGHVGEVKEFKLFDGKKMLSLEDLTNKFSRKYGIDLSKYKPTILSCHHMIPDKPEFYESAIAYFKRAIDYMKNRLNLSEFKPIKWVPVKNKSENYTHDLEGKCFVGHSMYKCFFAHYAHSDNKSKDIRILIQNDYNAGALLNSEEDSPFYGAITLSHHPAPIIGIFSEYGCVSLLDAYSKDIKKRGETIAKETFEAVSEAIANVLAEEVVDEFNIPNGKLIVGGYLRELKADCYRYVRPVLNWVKKNGVDNAISLYNRDPSKFLMRIIKK